MLTNPEKLSPAEKLLWSYGVREPGHIALDEIAYDLGATVQYLPLTGCEARLVAAGERAIITISSRSNPGRQRFSLGHELAHWICDRGKGMFLCALADLQADIGPNGTVAKNIEANANLYSSQLLLPDYLVGPWSSGRPISLDTANLLARDFRCSLTASAIKLVKYSLTPACLVCYGQSGRKWSLVSPKFPDEFSVSPQLHQDTDAFRMVFQSGVGISRPQRLPGDRWLWGRGADRLTTSAQSVNLEEGVVLSLVALFDPFGQDRAAKK